MLIKIQNLFFFLSLFILNACGNADNSSQESNLRDSISNIKEEAEAQINEEVSNEEEDGWKKAMFTADFQEKKYEVEVRYYLDEEGGITVYSDKNDVTDSNGDGLIVAMFQMGEDKIQLDLVDNELRYGGAIRDFEQSETELSGSGGLLAEEGSYQQIPIQFSLTFL